MPEGPSLVILREEVKHLEGKKIISAEGKLAFDHHELEGLKVKEIKTWGKHFLMVFNGFYIRVHFLLFGAYKINARKQGTLRLSLQFKDTELNFYACSIKRFDGKPDDTYDFETDVMAEEWKPAKALQQLKELKKTNVSDALLNQEIFSGVGNIIKNEVLFRIKVHPKSLVEKLPATKQKTLVKEASNYSFDFYDWKKAGVLKKHWLIYKKSKCGACNKTVKKEYIGITKRLTCYCNNCQVLYK